VRLVTFNMLHGRSPEDGRVLPDRLADALAELSPDVLALQEVDRDQPRSGRVDFTALAGAAMGAVDTRFAAAIAGTPGEVWAAATGTEQPGAAAYGVALLSRLPVSCWQLTRLRALPVPAPVIVPRRRLPLLTRDEPRVGIAAVVHTPHGPLTVATTHLSFVHGWNLVQLQHLRRALRELPGPRVLMGDLNLPAAVVRRVTGWRPLVDGPTFPADHPRVQLDHVLADGAVPPVRAARVVRLPLSDHRAAVVDF